MIWVSSRGVADNCVSGNLPPVLCGMASYRGVLTSVNQVGVVSLLWCLLVHLCDVPVDLLDLGFLCPGLCVDHWWFSVVASGILVSAMFLSCVFSCKHPPTSPGALLCVSPLQTKVGLLYMSYVFFWALVPAPLLCWRIPVCCWCPSSSSGPYCLFLCDDDGLHILWFSRRRAGRRMWWRSPLLICGACWKGRCSICCGLHTQLMWWWSAGGGVVWGCNVSGCFPKQSIWCRPDCPGFLCWMLEWRLC